MIILDSNIWIAYLDTDDSQHQKAIDIFRKLDTVVLITEYIILEVSTVLAMRLSKKVADEFLKKITDNRDIQILYSSRDFFDNIVSTFIEYPKRNLSFIDLSLLILAKDYSLKTFDKKLSNAIRRQA